MAKLIDARTQSWVVQTLPKAIGKAGRITNGVIVVTVSHVAQVFKLRLARATSLTALVKSRPTVVVAAVVTHRASLFVSKKCLLQS